MINVNFSFLFFQSYLILKLFVNIIKSKEYIQIIKKLESKKIMKLKYKNKISEYENKYLTELNNIMKYLKK